MNDLLPLNVKIKSEEKATPNDQISLSLLKQLPLQDQIKQLLLKGIHLLHFYYDIIL